MYVLHQIILYFNLVLSEMEDLANSAEIEKMCQVVGLCNLNPYINKMSNTCHILDSYVISKHCEYTRNCNETDLQK